MRITTLLGWAAALYAAAIILRRFSKKRLRARTVMILAITIGMASSALSSVRFAERSAGQMPPDPRKAQLFRPEYRIPSITAYNRLEASPRSANFDRSLKAEVRDPLWMLTRQWQFGEFEGEDAASPVTAQMIGEHTSMDRIRLAANAPVPYDERVVLETHAERETATGSLFIAIQMSRYFIKLMNAGGLQSTLSKFIAKYDLLYRSITTILKASF